MSAVPEKLGKYQVTGVLGEGAMGVVYKGFDPGIQRVVAIKTMRRALLDAGADGDTSVERFRNEARAAGRLSHPGIVAVYDFGEDRSEQGELAYIAMEFVEGNTLQRYIANQVNFGEPDIVSTLSQLLDALEHAHAQGVWHRDIKPANVLMTRDGRVKVADFGIARIESVAITQMGAMVGTPSYMAPEQFLGAEIDRRVDIYACGVLLYQLLVGKPPFSGRTEALMYSVVYEEPVLPSAVPGYTGPRQYDALLARALAKKPDQRFASAAAFRQALLEVVGRPVPATVSDETIIALPPRGASRAGAPAGPGSASGRSTGLGTPTSWSPVVLGQVEATLARHVGPLASVLVRRTARECADLPSLVARLADQMTDASARQAFLAAAAPSSRSNQGRVATGGSSGGTREGGPSSAATSAVSDAWVAQATRLLAAEVGPIAGVLVKRTVASARGRDAVVSALADAAPAGAARDRLRAALLKLV